LPRTTATIAAIKRVTLAVVASLCRCRFASAQAPGGGQSMRLSPPQGSSVECLRTGIVAVPPFARRRRENRSTSSRHRRNLRGAARQSRTHRGLVPRCRAPGVGAPPGPPIRTSATIAPAAQRSEPESPRIRGNPPLSPRFQALVPEMERDRRRFAAIPETTEAPAVQELRRSGARGTRTPDLLGAIQALARRNPCSHAGFRRFQSAITPPSPRGCPAFLGMGCASSPKKNDRPLVHRAQLHRWRGWPGAQTVELGPGPAAQAGDIAISVKEDTAAARRLGARAVELGRELQILDLEMLELGL